MVAIPEFRGPHEAERNAGPASPDSTSFHPGYPASSRSFLSFAQ